MPKSYLIWGIQAFILSFGINTDAHFDKGSEPSKPGLHGGLPEDFRYEADPPKKPGEKTPYEDEIIGEIERVQQFLPENLRISSLVLRDQWIESRDGKMSDSMMSPYRPTDFTADGKEVFLNTKGSSPFLRRVVLTHEFGHCVVNDHLGIEKDGKYWTISMIQTVNRRMQSDPSYLEIKQLKLKEEEIEEEIKSLKKSLPWGYREDHPTAVQLAERRTVGNSIISARMEKEKAVSYTHLTLPTILRV